MPRRKKAPQQPALRQVQVSASDLFDPAHWSGNSSGMLEASDSEMDVDENILRLLSESDTSMERSGHSVPSPQEARRGGIKVGTGGLDHLYSSPMRAPFHAAFHAGVALAEQPQDVLVHVHFRVR
ncbi:MAG: hypothetical protein EOP84_21425, partial [Verrucomicrobiaceae bacterium]